ncbi:MAG: IF-2 protein, partial [Myxococcaceae bacterium]|nr:IF-2 protein [Myxococcaceae bacterium]
FLLSQLNARTFAVERRGEQLVVLKGRRLPWGHVPYAPGDARSVDAYAPIPAEGESPAGLVGQRFSDREELDRALFQLFAERAQSRILSDAPAKQEQGLAYLRRAELLSGVTEEQRRTLRRLQADAAFYQARSKLDEARRMVAEALTQLRLAAESQNPNARAANQMLSEVGPAARALEDSLRRAVHTLSGPAGAGTTQPPAPDSQQQPLPPGPDAPARPQGPPTPEPTPHSRADAGMP